MSCRRAFTLIELLIVVMAMFLLAAILLPALGRSWEMARRAQCQSNMRQLTAACLSYAMQNHDAFLLLSSPNAQAGFPTSDNQSQVIPALYRYAPDARVFHCPSDIRPNVVENNSLSYNINDYLNGTWPAFAHAVHVSEIRDSSSVFALVEEYDTNPKQANNSGGFVVMPAPSTVWVDWPGIFHGTGTCLSFVDGHVEYWEWNDPRTLTLSKHLTPSPNNPDLIRFQTVQGVPH
jgi:type II secretory pathway pseudopilin PulG